MLNREYAPARAALRRVVDSMIADGRQTMRLHLDVGGADIGKNVIVTFGRANEGTHFDEVWSLHWEPENGGPFPEFNGWLSVQYAGGGRGQLEIRGEYAPPLGAFGKGFDLVLGQRIAAQTCKNLLGDIAVLVQAGAAVSA